MNRQTWEVEQKYVVDDPDVLIERVEHWEFQPAGETVQVDCYLRHPCRDFQTSGEAFRLRQDGSRQHVTYKGPRTEAEVKSRPEIELEIGGDFNQWRQLMELLGFQPLPAVRKRRQLFLAPESIARWKGVRVMVDHVERLGVFAEIEVVVNDQRALPLAQQTVQDVAMALQLDTIETRSYLTMVLETVATDGPQGSEKTAYPAT
ncbi:MAG: hypothetical protein KatS3mg111_2881 [Pirellulaceae bacterium]|nr:MAG: hypothetical protein KatS3mg111_2881 [Pirellulaceae bacterium]